MLKIMSKKNMIRYETQKGQFVKHCPCTPDVVSCGYYNLNLHTGCPYCCSYCILQAYLETKGPIFFTNIEDMEKELTEISRTHRHLRIGTGELSDSLALDTGTNYSKKILGIFEKFPEIVFEFKTKSANINNILEYIKETPGSARSRFQNIVMAWSLNPVEVIEREELLTADLEARLSALKSMQQQGFKIGIHFDPLLIFEGWQEAYSRLIKQIADTVDPGRIAWWSLGALRFPYALREHIFKHQDSKLFEGELIKGHDGKYRYFKPLRLELFRFMVQHIRQFISPHVPLYLCMENAEVWHEILPEMPTDEAGVNKRLYESVIPPILDITDKPTK
jgi:spore photoproduct lyase